MNDEGPFDRRLRRLRRDRAAPRFEGADYLHRLAADELLERLDLVKREFRLALDLGFAFAAGAGGLQCDEDRLPFADAAFDLILSVGTLDTVNDLPGALILARRALKPDGLFMAAFAAAGSLARLKQAMLAADEQAGGVAAHVHPQIDVRAAGDLLTRAGFALPVVDAHGVDVRFSSFGRLIGDLRAMAATNILANRARRPLGRAALVAALGDFAAGAEAGGKVAERFEILHLLGWAPAPDQPRPARRGSGTVSLGEALRPR
jgi:SAM-dependent methyltransferase